MAEFVCVKMENIEDELTQRMDRDMEEEMTQVIPQDPLALDGLVEVLDMEEVIEEEETEYVIGQVEVGQYEEEEGEEQMIDMSLMQNYEMVEVDEHGDPIETVYAYSTTVPCYDGADPDPDTQFPLEDGEQIRIRDFREIAENYAVAKRQLDIAVAAQAEAEGELADADGQSEKEVKNLPFPCTLCSETFQKKLFLNNHMERRHGIKFVFTERGKKVKLIRMPQEVTAGEKLDPCVEALMQQNGQNSSNILGVQTLDLKKQAEEFPSAHEVDPFDLFQGTDRAERDFGAGILVAKIQTYAMKVALERKETPFAVYRPLRSKRIYLLSIQHLNEDMQLLLPATEKDLKAADGVESEPSFYFTHRANFESTNEQSSTDGGREVVKRVCTKFSHVAIVALAEQTLDESNKVQIKVHPPPSPETVSLIKFKHFARTIIQCQPKRLRCLSFPPKTAAGQVTESAEVEMTRRKRRKYKRRTQEEKEAKKTKKREVKSRKRPRRVQTSDEESEFEALSETSDDEESPVLSPASESDRVRTPPPTPKRKQRRHPVETEVLAPPKRKYERRGRPRKNSVCTALTKKMKRIKLESLPEPEASDEENQDPMLMRNSPHTASTAASQCHRGRRRGRKELLHDVVANEEEEANEGDRESEGQDTSSSNSKTEVGVGPMKKRGRGRPRKYPLLE